MQEPGLITGQRTDPAHVPQLKTLHAATKDPAAVKIFTCHNQDLAQPKNKIKNNFLSTFCFLVSQLVFMQDF